MINPVHEQFKLCMDEIDPDSLLYDKMCELWVRIESETTDLEMKIYNFHQMLDKNTISIPANTTADGRLVYPDDDVYRIDLYDMEVVKEKIMETDGGAAYYVSGSVSIPINKCYAEYEKAEEVLHYLCYHEIN